jgi:excisionase family DNA binding protein
MPIRVMGGIVEDRFLNIKETSHFLKLHISTINRLIEAAEIPSYKVRKRRLCDREELVEWVKSHRDRKLIRRAKKERPSRFPG